MNKIALEILAMLFLLGLNGVLAMTEMCLISSKRVRLEKRARDGEQGAVAALELLGNPTRLLSTIQVGITLIGILTGVFGGATIAEQLAALLQDYPLVGQYAESVSIFTIVMIITYFSLVFGELVPKRLAMRNPETLAVLLARPMRFMTRLTGPVVTVLSKSTELILKLWGSQNSEQGAAVEEEIRLLLREGTQSGALEDVESQMVESVFRLDDRKAETIMTPRTSIQWLDCNWNHVELKERLVSGTHSIYPVGHGSLDNTTGYVKTHDILTQMFRDQPLHLTDVMMPGLYLPSTTTALAVLEALRREGSPLAFLVDEHGGLVGMVTLRDLLESIVGFIPDSDELGSPQYVSREDGSYLINGMLSVHEFLTLMDSEVGNDDDTPDYNTVGGLVMGELERLPIEGDVILWKGIQIEVVDMDGRRVDKVITKRITGEEAE